jgi:hypothetical protein
MERNKKDVATFESLTAIKERFTKLKDTMAAAMRHAAPWAESQGDTFLKNFSFYEKAGVLESVSSW